MTSDPADGLLTIGDFARRVGLTAKALRIYDDIGLLRPATVDPRNGYRRYGVDQVRRARLIGLLRGADLTLAEIGHLLADLDTDPEVAGRHLDRHLDAVEARHSARRLLIRHIHATLRDEDLSMFPIQTRTVAASPPATATTTASAGTRLSCREVYLAEPNAVGDDDLLCDIAFPLA